LKRAITVILLAIVVGFFLKFDTFYFIEKPMAGKLTSKTHQGDARLKILAIDDESLEKIGRFPWQRDIMANLMEKLAANGALAVWPDILYTEPSTNPEDDSYMAEVVAGYENIYLPAYFEMQTLQESRDALALKSFHPPVFPIPKERLGHINFILDDDKVVRKTVLGLPMPDGEILPSIDVRLANLLLPEEERITWDENNVWERGEEIIPVDNRNRIGFTYASSTSEASFEVIPIWQVIEDQIDPAYFEGSVVLIGPYSVGLMDQYMTPMGKGQMFGVEIHANVIQAFLDNGLYSPLADHFALAVVILLALLGYALFEWLRARLGALILVIMIFAYSGVVYYAYHYHQVLLPYFYVLFALILAYVVSIVGQYLRERKERNRVTGIFGRYVSKAVVNEILSEQEEIKVGGVRKDVTLMFVDIRGFTPLSEKMEPEEVINILNEYLDLCTKAVFKFEGTLDKFIGDGVMSFFGAPIAQEDHAARAARAALEMKKNSGRLAEDLEKRYGRAVYFGIGINSGPAVIGNIGSKDRVDYTAIGDTVNLAARLESNAKPGQILISAETYERIKDKFDCTELEPIKVKGKEKPVQIYQLDAEKDSQA